MQVLVINSLYYMTDAKVKQFEFECPALLAAFGTVNNRLSIARIHCRLIKHKPN